LLTCNLQTCNPKSEPLSKEVNWMDVALDRHIEMTPDVRGGKPHIAATRITVADVALMYLRLGYSLEEIAGTYDLSLAAVYAAMAYYYDHREAVEQSIAEDEAFAEALRQETPSPLLAKLRALKDG
jgi:uncharacterized protein (DUF433 family)